MDASDTCHGNGLDSRGINLAILIRDAYSGNPLIKINLHCFVGTTDPTTLSGKADMAGETSEEYPQSLRRGSGDSMYTR